MVQKIISLVLLVMAFATIAVSAVQLIKQPTAGVACGSPCTQPTRVCAAPCNCVITVGGGTFKGVCQPPLQLR
ncbi:MAG TPA: hypothetical protein VI685_22890 [Candidatus Angelobacter sp.]